MDALFIHISLLQAEINRKADLERQKAQTEMNRKPDLERQQAEAWKIPESSLIPQGTDPDNLYRLGRRHYDRQEYFRAVLCFQRAIDSDDETKRASRSDAYYAMGFAYEYGRGITQDLYLAQGHYRKAAELGNVMGMHKIGDTFRAASLGYAPAQYDVGLKKVLAGNKNGLKCIKKSAAQSYRPAIEFLKHYQENSSTPLEVMKDEKEVKQLSSVPAAAESIKLSQPVEHQIVTVARGLSAAVARSRVESVRFYSEAQKKQELDDDQVAMQVCCPGMKSGCAIL